MLADAGQDLIEYPALKLLCTGELATGDQAVDVAFGDEVDFLHFSADRATAFHRSPTMLRDSIVGASVAQSLCYIASAEQHLAVLFQGSDFAEVGVVKGLKFVRWFSSFFSIRWAKTNMKRLIRMYDYLKWGKK